MLLYRLQRIIGNFLKGWLVRKLIEISASLWYYFGDINNEQCPTDWNNTRAIPVPQSRNMNDVPAYALHQKCNSYSGFW